jgi:hypothetical protein
MEKTYKNMKIHIALVGAQTLPAYWGILEVNPDIVYFIHSIKTKEQANQLSKSINIESYLIETNPIDFNDVKTKINKLLLEENKNSTISIDITGGTKIMSLAAYGFINMCDRVFYIDQNNKIFDFISLIKAPIEKTINTEKFFELNGYPLKSFKHLGDYSEDEVKAFHKVRDLLSFSPGEFYQLVKPLSKHTYEMNYKTKRGSSYNYKKSEGVVEIELKKWKKLIKRRFEFKNAHKYIINTYWFELEIASIFSKWDKAVDILHNVIVPYSSGADKNEIDLVINTGQKLIFVECKTQVTDIKDIDKFRNVVKNYGGLGAKALLVTDSPINDRVKEKCHDNGILSFSLAEAKKNTFLNVSQSLFSLLESELYYSNPI